MIVRLPDRRASVRYGRVRTVLLCALGIITVAPVVVISDRSGPKPKPTISRVEYCERDALIALQNQ